jgi:hypothetical protein
MPSPSRPDTWRHGSGDCPSWSPLPQLRGERTRQWDPRRKDSYFSRSAVRTRCAFWASARSHPSRYDERVRVSRERLKLLKIGCDDHYVEVLTVVCSLPKLDAHISSVGRTSLVGDAHNSFEEFILIDHHAPGGYCSSVLLSSAIISRRRGRDGVPVVLSAGRPRSAPVSQHVGARSRQQPRVAVAPAMRSSRALGCGRNGCPWPRKTR